MYRRKLKYAYSDLCAPVPSIAPLYCSPFTSYGTGIYAGTAASNFNAINTAINTVTDRCPSCTANNLRYPTREATLIRGLPLFI